MRGKLIAVYSLIVVVVGLLALVLMAASLTRLISNPDRARDEAAHAAAAAVADLELQSLIVERWLVDETADPLLRDLFKADTPAAKSEYATAQADRINARASQHFASAGLPRPQLIALVDNDAISLGRNGSSLLRGEPLGKPYPALSATIKRGTSGSDIWVNRQRNEQMLVSYAAIRDANGQILGGLLIGIPIDDDLLNAISSRTSGKPLALVSATDRSVVAKSSNVAATSSLVGAAQGPLVNAIASLFGSRRPQQIDGGPADLAISGVGLGPRQAALVAASPIALVDNSSSLLVPILGATFLGLLLVFLASNFFDTYLTRPIIELEEGLLAVINGQTDRRFEIEHAEYGGLVFRINTLLNTLMGVAEDNTDEEGRPSIAPSPATFRDALDVDDRPVESIDQATAASLHAEAADTYYDRLFREYIDARRSVGQPVDHITKQAFIERIKASEADMAARQGKPVRYKVETRANEVTLIAISMG